MQAGRAALYPLYHFLYWGAAGLWWPFVFPLLTSRGVSLGHLGLLVAVWPLCALLAQPAAGWLCDRTGRARLVLCLLTLGASAALPLLALARGLRGELPAVAAFALLNAPTAPLGDALTIAHLRHAGGEYGRVRLWGSLSFALLGLAAGWALAHGAIGLRGLFVLAGALTLPSALLPLRFPTESAGVGRPVARLRDLAGTRPLLLFLGLAAVALLPMSAHSTYFSLDLTRLGGTAAAQGAGWALPALAEVPFFLWGAAAARRLGLARTLQVAFACQAVSLGLIALAHGPALAVGGALVQGPAFALFYGAAVPAVDRLAPPGLRASGQALLWATCFGAGSIAANLLGGWVASAAGTAGLYRALALFALASAAAFALLLPREVRDS